MNQILSVVKAMDSVLCLLNFHLDNNVERQHFIQKIAFESAGIHSLKEVSQGMRGGGGH